MIFHIDGLWSEVDDNAGGIHGLNPLAVADTQNELAIPMPDRNYSFLFKRFVKSVVFRNINVVLQRFKEHAVQSH